MQDRLRQALLMQDIVAVGHVFYKEYFFIEVAGLGFGDGEVLAVTHYDEN